VGYFWLPHSAATAWFLTKEEREYAHSRVIQDRLSQAEALSTATNEDNDEDQEYDEESRGLLNPSKPPKAVDSDVTNDRGLTPHDVVSAFFSPKIWHILACNILSAIPVYAFQVFLPLVLAPLTDTPNPALVNLLTAPPYICGAITLYLFASFSDRHHIRILPILTGLALLIFGLTIVVLLPTTKAWAIPRYLALNVLLSGCFIASPLTVAWISGNTPSPGKRAILLGINGWGNLAGVMSALLFKPKYAESGYVVPFWWTLLSVALAAGGYVLFYRNLKGENEKRKSVLASWSAEDVERENIDGLGPLRQENRVAGFVVRVLKTVPRLHWVAEWFEEATEGGRQGDEKLSFVYGL
jgi:MFS family permease